MGKSLTSSVKMVLLHGQTEDTVYYKFEGLKSLDVGDKVAKVGRRTTDHPTHTHTHTHTHKDVSVKGM